MRDLLTEADATISECGLYRYTLTRRWADGPECVFVMLNPSTADALQDDPTIRRCIGFAKREGCGSLRVVNLFAFRATDPNDMMISRDPIGRENADHIHHAMNLPGVVAIAGWGANHMARAPGRALAKRYRLRCLGVTKDGSPRHPLYVKGDTPLVEFRP